MAGESSLRINRNDACAVAVLIGVSTAMFATLGAPLLAPVGPEVPMWVEAALQWRWGGTPQVPWLYPVLSAALGAFCGGALTLAGQWVSTVAAISLPVTAYALSRWLGARAIPAAVGALVVLGCGDTWGHGLAFAPDVLAALFVTLGVGLCLGARAQSTWFAAVVAALALVAVREPGLPVVLCVALAVAKIGGVPRMRVFFAAAIIALGPALLAGRIPGSPWEWFPGLRRLAPLVRDVWGGDGASIVDLTAHWPGPWIAVERQVVDQYRDVVATTTPVRRVGWNLRHAVASAGDLYGVAILGVAGSWLASRRRGAIHLAATVPLLGSMFFYCQRSHAYLWIVVSGIGIASLLEWAVERWSRPAWFAAAAACTAWCLGGAEVARGALTWTYARVKMEAGNVELANIVRESSPWDELLVVEPRRGDRGLVLLSVAERPVLRNTPRSGPALWRTLMLAGAPPGEGWAAVGSADSRTVWRYRPDVTGAERECLRGEIVGLPDFGLAPGRPGTPVKAHPDPCH